jgi:enoyl-CoA hydratase/carnithine racemase
MLLFDKKLTAEEALERNLIAKVIPQASFQSEVERMVSHMKYHKTP